MAEVHITIWVSIGPVRTAEEGLFQECGKFFYMPKRLPRFFDDPGFALAA